MLNRLKIRIADIDEPLAGELVKTAQDRILLRVGLKSESFPSELESIAVEVVSAMYNRHQMNHEGVDSERVDVFSVKFVNDLLKEYEPELDEFKRLYQEEQDANLGKVRFL